MKSTDNKFFLGREWEELSVDYQLMFAESMQVLFINPALLKDMWDGYRKTYLN